MNMERTECSETSAYKIQTPGNYPEENIQHTERGGSLKSRIFWICLLTPGFTSTQSTITLSQTMWHMISFIIERLLKISIGQMELTFGMHINLAM